MQLFEEIFYFAVAGRLDSPIGVPHRGDTPAQQNELLDDFRDLESLPQPRREMALHALAPPTVKSSEIVAGVG